MSVEFYPTRDNYQLNGLPWCPEEWVGCAMLNPHYKKGLKNFTRGKRCGIDSTAFQTAEKRKSPDQPLELQLKAKTLVEAQGGLIEFIVHYDDVRGVDEKITYWINNAGKLKVRLEKERGTFETAEPAVAETIACARHYAIAAPPVPIAFSAQGVTVSQYLDCARELLRLRRPQDMLALGGFCIIGRNRSVRPMFYEVCRILLPEAARQGVKRVHLLGVQAVECLRIPADICRSVGLRLSTDGSGPETAGCKFGKETCEDGVARPLRKLGKPCEKWKDYHPNELARRNVEKLASICATL